MVNVMHSVLKLVHNGYLFENSGGVELNAELFIDTNLVASSRAACDQGKANRRACLL